MKTLVLASGSVGRKQLLERAHIPFIVDISSYEEDMSLKLEPKALAIYLSQGKAREVAKHHKQAVILGADSFAVLDSQLLGKPHTPKRAKEMLNMLSGKRHSFITGFTIIDADTGREESDVCETDVYFRTLSLEEIERYVKTEPILDKAAAYSSQGIGAAFIKRIDGEHTNITGLPLSLVSEKLKTFGIELI